MIENQAQVITNQVKNNIFLKMHQGHITENNQSFIMKNI